MKLQDVKHLIDDYFDKVNPLDIIKRLKALGYEFEPISDEYDSLFVQSMQQTIESNVVLEFAEIEGNYLFENTFLDSDRIIVYENVNYMEKTPSSDFKSAGNYQFALAA